MRNKYPGICYRCGEPVAVGEGHFEENLHKLVGSKQLFPVLDGPKWITQHAECAIKYRGTHVGREGQPKGERPK